MAIGISIVFLFFFICCAWIGYEAKSLCREAKYEYGGDCVSSLIKTLNDENKDYKKRNDAIWALGQFGDKKALPALQSYYTGNIPPREPLRKMLSQYELKKAIKLVQGEPNITASFWRGILNEK